MCLKKTKNKKHTPYFTPCSVVHNAHVLHLRYLTKTYSIFWSLIQLTTNNVSKLVCCLVHFYANLIQCFFFHIYLDKCNSRFETVVRNLCNVGSVSVRCIWGTAICLFILNEGGTSQRAQIRCTYISMLLKLCTSLPSCQTPPNNIAYWHHLLRGLIGAGVIYFTQCHGQICKSLNWLKGDTLKAVMEATLQITEAYHPVFGVNKILDTYHNLLNKIIDGVFLYCIAFVNY